MLTETCSVLSGDFPGQVERKKGKGLAVEFASAAAGIQFLKSRTNRGVPSPTLQIVFFKLEVPLGSLTYLRSLLNRANL